MYEETTATAKEVLTLRWCLHRDGPGRRLRQQRIPAGQPRTTLDLGTLPAGVYVLTLRNSTGVRVQKVVKE